MNNVVAFRHSAISRVQAPARPSLRRSSGALMCMTMPKRTLVAKWHISATDGRLECRWRSEGGERRDEDGSRGSWRRRAA